MPLRQLFLSGHIYGILTLPRRKNVAGGAVMDFYAVLDQVIDLLRSRGRVTYGALKLQFGLDNEQLEVLKDEIIAAQRLAVDEDNRVLVWVGDHAAASAQPPVSGTPALTSAPATDLEREPLSYTPK